MQLAGNRIIIWTMPWLPLPGPQSFAARSSQGLSWCQEPFSSLGSALTEQPIKLAFIIRSLSMHPKIKSGHATADAVGFISAFIKCSLQCETSLELHPLNCFHPNIIHLQKTAIGFCACANTQII